MSEPKNRKFYGWVVVLASFLISMFAMTIIGISSSFYMAPVCAELQCTYVEFSVINVVSSLVCMVVGLVLAPIVAKGHAKKVMLLASIICGGSFALLGTTTRIWQFYIFFGLCNVGYGGLTYLPINYLITNWFKDKKGLATSLAFSGSGIGGIFLSPAISWLITNMGWRTSLYISGITVIVTGVIACLLIKQSPESIGQKPYELAKSAAPKDASAPVKAPTVPAWEGVTRSQALASPAFWVLAVSLLCMGMMAAGIMTQVPTYFTEISISYAAIMSLYSLCSTAGKLVMGPVFDKVGLIWGFAIVCGCTALAIVCLLLSPTVSAMGYVFSVAIGFGTVVSVLGPPLITSAIFGRKAYAQIYSISNALFMLGCMVGPLVSSGLRTATGSYSSAWIAYLGIDVLCFVSAAFAMGFGKKLRKLPETTH